MKAMTINFFKKTILLQVFLFLSMIILFIVEQTYFPYEEIDSQVSLIEVSLFILLFILTPFMWYFLYKLKPIGKKLFILNLILGAVTYLVISENSYLVTSVNPLTRFLDLMENVLILLDGVILAFLFFTDVKEKFE